VQIEAQVVERFLRVLVARNLYRKTNFDTKVFLKMRGGYGMSANICYRVKVNNAGLMENERTFIADG
jgi:hypothetical protein